MDPPETSSRPDNEIERCVMQIETALQADPSDDTSVEADQVSTAPCFARDTKGREMNHIFLTDVVAAAKQQRQHLLKVERGESKALKTYVPRLLLFNDPAATQNILRWVHAFQQGHQEA